MVAGPLRDASFSYLNHEGEWQEEWKPEPEDTDVLPQLVRFEAMTTKGSLFWLVPLIADPLPPESMRLEGSIGFFEDGRRQPVSADHHDGVQVVCVGPQGTTFGGGQFNCRHSSIIKP